MIPFSQFCLAMKVAAAGPVSQEDAAAALQRYKKLEDSAPTMKQVGRYAGIGAAAAPIAAGLKDVIRGGKGADWKGRAGARNVIGTAVAGALTSGGIPLVRAHLDREAEKNTLRKYVAQGVAPKIAMDLFQFLPSDEFLKYASVSVGQWWEKEGGPFLAKGGDHATFKKMMVDAGIPEGMQTKFSRMAAEKYPPGHNLGRNARAENAYSAGRASRSSSGGSAGRRGFDPFDFEEAFRKARERRSQEEARGQGTHQERGRDYYGDTGSRERTGYRAEDAAREAAREEAVRSARARADEAFRKAQEEMGKNFRDSLHNINQRGVARHSIINHASGQRWSLGDAARDSTLARHATTGAAGLAALGAVGGYAASAPQKEDARNEYSKAKGAFGHLLGTVPVMATSGYALGKILSPQAATNGGLIGAGIGTALAAASHLHSESDASRKGRSVFRSGNDKRLAKLEANASRTSASHMSEAMPLATMRGLLSMIGEAGMRVTPVGTGAALSAVGTVGGGMSKKRHEYAALAEHDRMRKAAGVSAAKGWGRAKELLSGTRAKKLEEASEKAMRFSTTNMHRAEGVRGVEEVGTLSRRAVRSAKRSETLAHGAAQEAKHVRNIRGGLGVAGVGAATAAGVGAGKLQHSDPKKEKTSAMSGVTPAKPWAAGEYADMGKMGAGAPTRGGFLMASEVAPWRQPKLHTAIQHEPQQIVEKMGAARAEWLQKRAGATTPAGRLASSHRVGLPKVSAPPGPSIADTVPTFGQRLPGANKTTIGKRSIREIPTLASAPPPQG